MKKLLFVTAIMLGFAAGAFAQVSATATATATIVAPIAITKDVDMNFGNVAVLAGQGGTVVLTPAGGRTATDGVTLPATAGTVTAASFTVTGTTGYTYAITLPAGTTTIDDNASHSMTVDTWTSNPTTPGTIAVDPLLAPLTVGATLHVGAGQVAGTYTSDTPFTVMVNYN